MAAIKRKTKRRTYGGWNEDMPGGKNIVVNSIAYMKTRFNIDPGKVFIGGYSGVGDMAYYAAFNHSNTFAGVITIAGWGTDFFHWSLVAAGKNNVNTQFMNLIQGSFVT